MPCLLLTVPFLQHGMDECHTPDWPHSNLETNSSLLSDLMLPSRPHYTTTVRRVPDSTRTQSNSIVAHFNFPPLSVKNFPLAGSAVAASIWTAQACGDKPTRETLGESSQAPQDQASNPSLALWTDLPLSTIFPRVDQLQTQSHAFQPNDCPSLLPSSASCTHAIFRTLAGSVARQRRVVTFGRPD